MDMITQGADAHNATKALPANSNVIEIIPLHKSHARAIITGINLPVAVLIHPQALRLLRSQSMSNSIPDPFIEQPAKRCSRGEKCVHPKGPWLPETREYFYAEKKAKSGLKAECKRCYVARICHWQQQHPEKVNAKNRRWVRENPEKQLQAVAHWQQQHPEKVLAQVHKRRARKLAAGGTFTTDDMALQLKNQTDRKGITRCWWCDKPLGDDQSVDHRVPLSKGGSNSPGNIVIVHLRCNLSKHDKLPHEWNGRLL